MRVARAVRGDLPTLHNALRLLNRELGALDEVGEVRLEERHRAVEVARYSGQVGRDVGVGGHGREVARQVVEGLDPARVVFLTGGTGGE